MAFNEYHFTTRWHLSASPQEVYELIAEPREYPVWMHHLKIRVKTVTSGDAAGVGRVDRFEMKGLLPYQLSWQVRCVEAAKPQRIVGEASGDFEGRGVWTFAERWRATDVTFDWRVRVHKPFLRYTSFILRPFFQWNHDWVMNRWEKDLQAEIQRRQTRKNPETAKEF